MKIVPSQRLFGVLAFVGLAVAVGVGCGGDDGDDGTEPTVDLGACDMTVGTAPGAAIVDASCATAGCHAAMPTNPNAPDLSTEALRIEHAMHMYEAISDNSMPPGGAGLPSADKESVRNYLACITQ